MCMYIYIYIFMYLFICASWSGLAGPAWLASPAGPASPAGQPGSWARPIHVHMYKHIYIYIYANICFCTCGFLSKYMCLIYGPSCSVTPPTETKQASSPAIRSAVVFGAGPSNNAPRDWFAGGLLEPRPWPLPSSLLYALLSSQKVIYVNRLLWSNICDQFCFLCFVVSVLGIHSSGLSNCFRAELQRMWRRSSCWTQLQHLISIYHALSQLVRQQPRLMDRLQRSYA